MMERVVSYIFLIFIFLNLQACHAQQKEQKMSAQPELYILNFGIEGEKKFKSYMQTGVDQQPAGMSFFDLTWEPPHLANIKIDLGENSFVIKNAFSAMGTRIDYTQQNEGIQIIDVTAGLNKEEFVSQEQAYMAYKELFGQLQKAGWEQYFYPNTSRIAKQDNIKSMIEDGLIIDPYNFLTLTEWTDFFNKKPTVAVRLYNHGIFLEMSIDKTKSENDKKQYMLRYSMETIRYNTKNSIKDGYKLSGQELKTAFNERMKYNEKQRAKVENQAKKEGFHIDESYQDPDVWQYVK
ncbi:TPA: hypothetical protein R7R87_000706 [Acinetobacter baumannii]|nr:hypothetical protein EGU01_10285 [Acinetobacter baumannii]HDQ4282772.1 hypothetical protein [Acinetobacter baumannii]HEE6387181.1 hypothetical protein [Acinetobacter baumannii]HEE6445050.1 hypothetical protein [Acinetobacter baumannii]